MDWVQVAVAGSAMEMELLRGRLEGAKLVVRVEATGPFGSTVVFGDLSRLGGGYRLLVPQHQAEVARALLAPAQEQPPPADEPSR